MRSLTLILFSTLFLTLCGSAAARQREDEESQYRWELVRGASAALVIDAKSNALPAATPLKVFLLAPEQDEVAQGFRQWVGEWNLMDGKLYGRVEFVTEATQADVILARFLAPFKTKKYGEPHGEELWTVMGSSRTRPGTPMPPEGVDALPRPAAVTYVSNVYAYIAVREGKMLKLLWRGKDTVRVKGGTRDSAYVPADPKGEKDSRAPGDRLRDQFFRLLKARPPSQEK